MKKSWIIAAAAVVLVAVLVVVVLVLTSGRSWDSGDEDSLYPYRFRETSEGLQLAIEGEIPEGFVWSAESDDISIVSVEQTDQDDDEAEFLIAPIRYGTAGVTCRLVRDSESIDLSLYEIRVMLDVDREQNLSVTDNSHREINRTAVVIPETDCIMTPEADGALVMTFADRSWTAQELNTAIVNIEHNENTIRFTGADIGTTTIYVRSPDDGMQLQLQLQVDSKLAVTYVSHTAGEYKDPFASEDFALFRQFYGNVTLPVDAALAELRVDTVTSQANGTDHVVGVIRFRCQEQNWVFRISNTAGAADLFGAAVKTAQPERQLEVDGISAEIYRISDGAAMIWTDSQGCGVSVFCETASADDLAAIAPAMMKVVEHG